MKSSHSFFLYFIKFLKLDLKRVMETKTKVTVNFYYLKIFTFESDSPSANQKSKDNLQRIKVRRANLIEKMRNIKEQNPLDEDTDDQKENMDTNDVSMVVTPQVSDNEAPKFKEERSKLTRPGFGQFRYSTSNCNSSTKLSSAKLTKIARKSTNDISNRPPFNNSTKIKHDDMHLFAEVILTFYNLEVIIIF